MDERLYVGGSLG